MKRSPVFLAVVFLALAACARYGEQGGSLRVNLDADLAATLTRASEGVGSDFYLLPASGDYDNIPQDPRNALTPARVELGKLLFHETALATKPKMPLGEGTYSCASCHHAKAGFQAGIIQGIADGGIGFGRGGRDRTVNPTYPTHSLDVQPIRTPSTLNIAYQRNVLWSGALGATGVNTGTKFAWMPGTPLAFNRFGFEGVETQAIVALDVHRLRLTGIIEAYPEYKELFDRAFPEVPEERRYTKRFTGLAIAAYERTLLANEAPFQQWLRGDRSAMSPAQKQGAILFFGKAKCFECHNGPALNSMRFVALGMKDLFHNSSALNSAVDSLPNLGRAGFTRRGTDLFAFKVPQLYNLVDAPFYGHGASFTDIRDVVSYKNRARPENPNVREHFLAEQFKPLGLTGVEIDAITVFLAGALRDGNLVRYLPAKLPSGNCFPNNDPQSRADMGCR